MAYPAYSDRAIFSVVAGSTSLDVNYNTTINANDVLIILLQVFGSRTFITPSGWTLLSSATGARSSAAFIKRATGSESGTETCTISSSANLTGQMVRYTAVSLAEIFYEDNQATALVNGSTIAIPSLTTTGVERLCVALYVIDDNQNPSDPTDYTEQFVEEQASYSTTFVGNDQEIATASTVDADSSSLISSENHFVYAFALLPVSGATDDLTSTDLETGDTVISSATIGQIHALISQDIETGLPAISNPTLTDVSGVDNLVSQDLEAGSIIIGNSTIGQIHVLLSEILESQNVVISQPTLSEDADILTAQDIETAAPIITQAILGQIHNLTSQDLVTGNTVISQPSLTKDPFAFILKIMPRTFADYELTQTQINNFQNKL